MRTIITGLIVGLLMVSSQVVFADTVYATKNGKKYHHAECPLIVKKSPAAVSMEEAVQKGLTPCGKCFKDTSKAELSGNPKLVGKK